MLLLMILLIILVLFLLMVFIGRLISVSEPEKEMYDKLFAKLERDQERRSSGKKKY